MLQLSDIFEGEFAAEAHGNIRFETMTMYVSLHDMTLKVRRLTTMSYICTGADVSSRAAASVDGSLREYSTKWVWYWQTPEGTWNKYEV